ncbi:MAG: hypothetical protein II042_00885, partial [Erysipelotrichaceae bacterium]|nr:hypothetical protein [Erysipelotrichaceae bacterium]
DYMLSLGGLLPQSVDITGNKIIDTLIRVVGFIATLPVQRPAKRPVMIGVRIPKPDKSRTIATPDQRPRIIPNIKLLI